MRAVVVTAYGPPDVLRIEDVEKPAPNDDQVLVRVRALSLNPAEAHMRNGMLAARLMQGGWWRPRDPIPGADFAGVVEAVGKNITGYRPGDAVYGRRGRDGLAEYVCAPETLIAPKPANVTFEQAAAVPVAGVTALQALRDFGHVGPGQTVLINGAAGGLGTFTVQIAKAFGAEVTAVTSTQNLELARSLGADRVVDYTREDFSRSGQRFDVIIDNVGNHPLADLFRVLKPNGIGVITGYWSMGHLIQFLAVAPLMSRMGSKKVGSMLAQIRHPDLLALNGLMESGELTPCVDRTYPLSEAAEAYRYLETRHARGKIVIVMDRENS